MIFQLVNNVRLTLANALPSDATELMVLESDLSDASRYDPTKQLAMTLVGDEELNQYEIVYATQRTGTTFIISRGEEDTTAGDWPAGTSIVAALTADVLYGVTQAPTTGDNVSYGGGNFGASSTVEKAIDDQGDAIIRLASDTEYYEAVLQRVGGGLFSGGVAVPSSTGVLRWQGSCKKFTTNGLGADLITTATLTQTVVVPDIVLCVRCPDVTNLASIKVRAYNNAAPTNYIEWTLTSLAYPNTWIMAFLPAASGTIAGVPSANLPDRVQLTFKDKATGVLATDINFLDVVPVRLSYLGAFLRVAIATDFDKVNAIAQYGFRVSLVIKDTDLLTLDPVVLRRVQVDGHRIYLTSTSNFKLQTLNQSLTTLYTALRNAFAIYVKPDGWVYFNNFDGPFDLEPTRTVRGAVSTVFPRGVGIGAYRSAVEVYRFDDPLITATSLANAQAYMTGTDTTALNIDLSVLTVAELNTLMTGVVTTGNFYTTTLDYQNADNLKSGTVNPARLPSIPSTLGGVPAGTVIWTVYSGTHAGYLMCNGQAVSRTTYSVLFTLIGTAYGVGNGTTTFNVPDLRGAFVRGSDAGRGIDPGRSLGTTQTSQMPAHDHGTNTGPQSATHAHSISGLQTGNRIGAHNHQLAGGQNFVGWGNATGTFLGTTWGGGQNLYSTGTTTTTESADHTHDVTGSVGNASVGHTHTIASEGTGTETRPYNVALNAQIKY